MSKEIFDEESVGKRDKKFTRVFAIAILLAFAGGVILSLFSGEIDFVIMATLLYVLVFQLFIFIWVFRLHYHLVPVLLKDDDESMKLDEID